jgi:hypothetical protein
MSNTFRCGSCKGTYSDTQRDGTIYFHACAPLPPDKDGIQEEVPNKRDENLSLDARGRLQGIVAEGAGVTCLTNAQLTEPAWLTAVNKQVAKQEDF